MYFSVKRRQAAHENCYLKVFETEAKAKYARKRLQKGTVACAADK